MSSPPKIRFELARSQSGGSHPVLNPGIILYLQSIVIKDYMVLNIFEGAAAAESALHKPWNAGLRASLQWRGVTPVARDDSSCLFS
jgi:hypothetical protein